ncbi:MAG: DUF1071 domain-containing protein [Oscillospiraceae bacterium]|nr:DUF1071 domain-containing protein [Oscillospiraceae bacterium]
MEAKKSVFEVLNAVNCNEHTEKKNGLTYLSWAWAWAEVKKRYPSATYTIYENKDGLLYHTDGKTAWVKTGVTIEGIELIEYLPVMNYKNESINLDRLTSFDVNKTVQRSLTKACARHGLGLYIYAGEDLPEGEDEKPAEPKKTAPKKKAEPAPAPVPTPADDKDDFYLVKQLISECKTKEELLKLWEEWPELHEQIKPLFSAKRKELNF